MAEMAIVIVIVAILAAMAMPKMAESERAAQVASAKDFLLKLKTAAGLYTAKNQKMPTSFALFVTTQDLNEATMPDMFITLKQFGKGNCTVAGSTITCPADALPALGAFTYTFSTATEMSLNCPVCYQ